MIPYFRSSQPEPLPSVRPAMPVWRHAPAGDREPVLLGGGVEFAPGEPGAEAAGALVDVDRDALHRAGVDDDPPSQLECPGVECPPPRTATIEAVLAGVGERRRHVAGAGAARDQSRALVVHPVVELAGLVVVGVIGSDQLAGEARFERP